MFLHSCITIEVVVSLKSINYVFLMKWELTGCCNCWKWPIGKQAWRALRHFFSPLVLTTNSWGRERDVWYSNNLIQYSPSGLSCDCWDVVDSNSGNSPKTQLWISTGAHENEAGRMENQVTWVILDMPLTSSQHLFTHLYWLWHLLLCLSPKLGTKYVAEVEWGEITSSKRLDWASCSPCWKNDVTKRNCTLTN